MSISVVPSSIFVPENFVYYATLWMCTCGAMSCYILSRHWSAETQYCKHRHVCTYMSYLNHIHIHIHSNNALRMLERHPLRLLPSLAEHPGSNLSSSDRQEAWKTGWGHKGTVEQCKDTSQNYSSKSTYPTRALHLHYRATWTYAVDDLYLHIRGQCAWAETHV